MANRITTHILKNSDVIARPLPSVLLKGEPIINTAEGIMFFSGSTSSTAGWTQAGPNPSFFEVGSNLYDLKIRNRITAYNGLTNLTGKFLSGTTSGFVLADIANIVGVDTYVTGGTYNAGTATFRNNFGASFNVTGFKESDLVVTGATGNDSVKTYTFTNNTGGTFTVNALSDIRVTGGTFSNGTAIFTNSTGGTFNVAGFSDVRVTGGTANDSAKTYTFTNNTGGTFNVNALNDIRVTGGTYSNGTAIFSNNTGGTFNVTGFKESDTVVTGATGNDSAKTYTFTNNTGGTFSVNALSDIRVTGGTFSNGTASFTNSTGGTFNVGGFATGTSSSDTYVSGFTYTPTQNKFTIAQNGIANLDVTLSAVSGLTVSDLATNRLVYTTTGGKLLTGTAVFDGTNTNLPSNGSLTVGSGGLIIGSGGSPSVAGTGDLIVNGNITVFGNAFSAFTSQLYVEDNNISLNFNPTGSTVATSVGAGWTIQDGNGVSTGDVNFDIRAMNVFSGLTGTQIPNVSEYGGATGYANRGFVTQLNDIVIRSTNINTPNGVRLLAEFDVLDGGVY